MYQIITRGLSDKNLNDFPTKFSNIIFNENMKVTKTEFIVLYTRQIIALVFLPSLLSLIFVSKDTGLPIDYLTFKLTL